MSKAVGVLICGETTWHAAGVVSDYDTLCGIDANDPGLGFDGLVEAHKGQKITCAECKTVWLRMQALRLRSSDFA